jgi:HEAT repeat protein
LENAADSLERAAAPEEKISASNEIGRILADPYFSAANESEEPSKVKESLKTKAKARCLEALKIQMRDSNALVRAAAARAAAGLKEMAIDALAALLSDPEEIVRLSAIQALGDTGEAAAAKALSDAFRGERSEELRIEMAAAFSRSCERTNFELFEKALDDESQKVASYAIDALERITCIKFDRSRKRWKEWLETNRKYAPKPRPAADGK